jgi:hypothetical protein
LLLEFAGIVPQHKPVAHQVPLDRGQRAADARIFRRQETHRRQQQDAGVEHLRTVRLDEGIQFGIESPRADIAVDGLA